MRLLRRVILLGVVCCGLVTTVELPPAKAQTITLTVSNETLHRIDPRMFGQFMERPSWGEIGAEGALVPGTNQLQPKVRELLEDMEVPVIRFPGGTDVDFMDLLPKNSVGL